jgi:TP901 family phage tail tape measure protein
MPQLTPIVALLTADIVAFQAGMDRAALVADESMSKVAAATVRANNSYRSLETATDALVVAYERLDAAQMSSTATADEVAAAQDRVDAAERRVASATDSAALAQQNLIRAEGLAAKAADDAALKQEAAALKIQAAQEKAAIAAEASAAKQRAAMMGTVTGAVASATSAYIEFGKMATIGLGIVAYESIKTAASFNTSMERLNTQAHVPQAEIAKLGDGVLTLAGQVAQNPDSLAEALYHVESNFASMHAKGFDALAVLRTAAEGARVGGADLVDVTNALTAALAANIPGVKTFNQSMGVLNATVGAGDMTMQDLASAFSTGVVASVKTYGASIQDVGAALAVFGDNNIRGRQAGTQLRMSMQAMEVPASAAGKALGRLGMNSKTLAQDMSTGGLLKALTDLHGRLRAAGIASKDTGAIVTELFGKRAGTGINILIDQFDRLKSKYPELNKGANEFDGAWKKTTEQFGVKMQQMGDGIKALGIRIGNDLIPYVSKAIDAIMKLVGWMEKHKKAAEQLGTALTILTVGAMAAWIASMIIAAGPVLLVIAAVTILVMWFKHLYDTNKQVRDVIKEVGDAFKKYGPPVLKAVWEEAQKLGKIFMDLLVPILKEAWKIVVSQLKPAWDDIQKTMRDNQPTVKLLEQGFKYLLIAIAAVVAIFVGGFIGGIVLASAAIVKMTLGAISDVIKAINAIRHAIDWVIDGFNKVKNMGNPFSGITSGISNGISSLGGGLGSLFHFDEGGTVPGAKGAPTLAIVHGGEYVVSNKMMSDGKIGGNVNYSGAGAPGGGGQPVVENHFYVDGTEIRASVQRQTLRYQQRNGINGFSLPAGRVA